MNAKKQRVLAVLMAAVLMMAMLAGCGSYGSDLTDTARDESNKASVNAPIPLSGFEDVTNDSGKCTYTMVAEFDATYTFTCDKAINLTAETNEGKFTAAGARLEAAVTAGDSVTVTVETEEGGEKFQVVATPDVNTQRLPYKANFTVDPSTLDLEGDSSKAPEATKIEYTKREGGTYVYLNNPEKLQAEDVGQAILRDEGLHGDVQVTWEHSNYTGQYVYLGYQLKNDGEDDAFVTVTNIGYQTTGEWLGQQSWSDYYNYKFDLPADYFEKNGITSEKYQGQDFIDYTPRVFQPMTYRIPAGEYIYVLGGTSADAHNNTNVADTGDKMVAPGKCTNAVAKMFITGGEVTGTFYCYTKAEQVQEEPEEQGYIVMRDGTQFGWQYKGVDYHQALIESNPVFVVNDKVEAGSSLPVTYENSYDKAAGFRAKNAYDEYKSETYTYTGKSWYTNINPQNGRKAVGTDMSTFECVTTDGETIVIDNEHADGTVAPANLGNWMIDYHDNMTLVNQGDKARTFTINKSANGALMTYVADPEGNVLSTKCTIVPLEGGPTREQWEIYKVVVPPHSVQQLTVSFLLMGNSYGNVNHWVTVE